METRSQVEKRPNVVIAMLKVLEIKETPIKCKYLHTKCIRRKTVDRAREISYRIKWLFSVGLFVPLECRQRSTARIIQNFEFLFECQCIKYMRGTEAVSFIYTYKLSRCVWSLHSCLSFFYRHSWQHLMNHSNSFFVCVVRIINTHIYYILSYRVDGVEKKATLIMDSIKTFIALYEISDWNDIVLALAPAMRIKCVHYLLLLAGLEFVCVMCIAFSRLVF